MDISKLMYFSHLEELLLDSCYKILHVLSRSSPALLTAVRMSQFITDEKIHSPILGSKKETLSVKLYYC